MPTHLWPKGSNGVLVVFANTVQKLESGTVWDFDSVTIETGATLEIGQGSKWTIIGCKGPFINKGTIRAAKADYGAYSKIETTAPDGIFLSCETFTTRGGDGGSAHTNSGPAPVGLGNFGNGGGGAAAFSHGNDATYDQGGTGGYTPPPGNNWRSGPGGA